ncbi:hypothetical protein G6F26_013304 [Rhizopus arrhizus]|nr:hypothetical protein G6F30_013250 [Rhizopus arrhizus]KAG0974920.1 hypothetical protein G6F28_013078 [Rhizopus arrhizus]KAG1014478.1 hypothetical protein G6F26_013304 [Rhizopus arrhizus]
METLKYYGMNKGTIYLQQDNDPKHKSKSTMTWLQQNKVRYINDWPPNSPDLNPIQHVWHLLKLRLSLYERKARNIDELWERVDVEWNKLDKDVCRSYIDSMPDRIAAVTLYRHGLDVVVPIFSPSVSKEYEHIIELKNPNELIKTKPYRLTWEEDTHLKEELKQLLEKGLIRPSKGRWTSPVFFVQKKDKGLRLVVDFVVEQ